jgi:hypothetical protein
MRKVACLLLGDLATNHWQVGVVQTRRFGRCLNLCVGGLLWPTLTIRTVVHDGFKTHGCDLNQILRTNLWRSSEVFSVTGNKCSHDDSPLI